MLIPHGSGMFQWFSASCEKPNRGEEIVSTKPRLKNVMVYCIVSSFNCMISKCPMAIRDISHTPMARYSLFLLKVLLNTNQLTI